MRTVKLRKNDDTVLDPADPGLITRGSLLLDGHECGTWEQHRDGSWSARIAKSGEQVVETSEAGLIARLAALD